MLRIRMSGIYTTVRQAFLALDSDHDGFITIEDFLRQFGDDKSLNFNDLKKLINSKDKQQQNENLKRYIEFKLLM